MGNGEWGMGTVSSPHSPLPTPHSLLFAWLLLAVLTVAAQRLPELTREEKWRGDLQYLFVELPKRHKNLFFKNLAPTVRPRDSRNHRVGSETFRFGDQIGASASDGDDRRPAHQNFIQCSENLSRHALSIF